MERRMTNRPRNLANPGKKLWDSTLEQYEFSDAELALLEEACRLRDHIALLDDVVKAEGVMSTSSQGVRVHPALVEARQSRLALARLLATLSIPPLEDDLPKSGRARGVYRRGA